MFNKNKVFKYIFFSVKEPKKWVYTHTQYKHDKVLQLRNISGDE